MTYQNQLKKDFINLLVYMVLKDRRIEYSYEFQKFKDYSDFWVADTINHIELCCVQVKYKDLPVLIKYSKGDDGFKIRTNNIAVAYLPNKYHRLSMKFISKTIWPNAKFFTGYITPLAGEGFIRKNVSFSHNHNVYSR